MLILDEPTRGIDVGAKAEIHRLMGELAGQGLAILMISSELPEVLGMSDRVLVVREGRIAAEFSRADATPERVAARDDGRRRGRRQDAKRGRVTRWLLNTVSQEWLLAIAIAALLWSWA